MNRWSFANAIACPGKKSHKSPGPFLQRQVCEADLERLQSRIATVLSKDPSCAAANALSAVAGKQRNLRDDSNYTLQLTQTGSSEHAAIQSGSQAGKYACDVLLTFWLVKAFLRTS